MSDMEKKVHEVNKKLAGGESHDGAVMNKLYDSLVNDRAARVACRVVQEEDFSIRDFLADGDKIKIACLDDLFQFAHISSDTLVHKSSNDLWQVEVDDDGQTFISKLFDSASGKPLKG